LLIEKQEIHQRQKFNNLLRISEFLFFRAKFRRFFFAFRSPDHPIYRSPDAQFRQSALISRKSAAEFGCGSAMLCLSASVVEFLFQSEIKNQKSKFPPSVLRFAYA
jgi:hypothetical protein